MTKIGTGPFNEEKLRFNEVVSELMSRALMVSDVETMLKRRLAD